jgi:hypothetical protein
MGQWANHQGCSVCISAKKVWWMRWSLNSLNNSDAQCGEKVWSSFWGNAPPKQQLQQYSISCLYKILVYIACRKDVHLGLQFWTVKQQGDTNIDQFADGIFRVQNAWKKLASKSKMIQTIVWATLQETEKLASKYLKGSLLLLSSIALRRSLGRVCASVLHLHACLAR